MGATPDPDPGVIEGVEPSVQVVLTEYDPSWAIRYEQLRDRIAEALGASALRIEHIGSTSVPGLTAKPIIDILVVVADVTDDEAFLPPLVDAGFVLRRREPDHRLLRTPARDVHIHVFSAGSREILDYLDFRDWLRVDEVSRIRYEAVKRELARLPWFTRDILEVEITGREGVTPYVRFGDALPVSVSLVLLAAAIGFARRKNH